MWILTVLVCNLAIVLIIEVSIGFFLGAKNPVKIITEVLVNIITNPAVVLCGLIMSLLCGKWQKTVILIMEVLVVFIEGGLYSRFKTFDKVSPYKASLMQNAASFITGELINIFL